MSAELLTSAELIIYAERSSISGFSNAQYAEAVVGAVDKIRQAALNAYTSASFESLTPATTPKEMRGYAFAIALDVLTKGDAQRPDSIGEGATEASKWLGYLVGGKTHYDQSPDPVLVKLPRGAGNSLAAKLPTPKMDRDDPRSPMALVDPMLGPR